MESNAMKKLLLATFLLLFPSLVWAQCIGLFPPNTICGNNTNAPNLPQPFSLSTSLTGPGTTVVGDLATWSNTSGTTLADTPPAALSGVNDTNVTITLGGTPATALVHATSITLGWTSQLSVPRGGTGIASGASGGIPYFSTTTSIASSGALNSLILGNGAGSAPTNYAGTTCTGTFVRSISNLGVATCQQINLTADVTGILPIANGGTNASTQAGAAASILPPPINPGDVIYWSGSSWITLTGNSSGTQVLSENSSGVPSWITVSGTGTVTTITPGGGIVSSTTASCSQSNITSSGTLSKAECVDAQTGTTFAIPDSDRGKLITASNAASQAYTIAQAGAASAFQAGWYVDVQNLSASGAAGAGTVTVTATTSTFSSTGTTTLKIFPGQTVRIISDGTNYQSVHITPGGGSPVLLATLVASSSASLSDTTSFLLGFNEYDLVFEAFVPSAAGNNFALQVHSGGTFQTTSYVGQTQVNSANAAVFAQPSTFIHFGSSETTTNPGLSGKCTIFGPPSQTTAPKQWTCYTAGQNGSSATTLMFSGYWNNTAAIDGFQVLSTSGNITSGTLKIYGRK
jgi:hypothetical protein